ncbi:MAG: pyridoxal phosphate-dependent aminotransferase [Synergistaceae bacterium]|nr:pyridoxal phosphate-dependent aminotransferase [Synergistaceae bacterium]
MRNFTASRVETLTPSGIRKVNERALAMERAGERIIHFEIGRPDFDTPEYIKRAAVKSLEEGEVFYTSNFGLMELREAVAGKLKRENGINCAAENVIVTAGLSEAVFDLLCTILDEGDELLVPDPVWLNYLNVPALLGARAVHYSLTEENGFEPDLDEIQKNISPRTKAIVIVTPNNPTGGVLSREKLSALAGIAAANDLLVISDEIYERLVYDGARPVSIASLPGMAERTVTLNGFSKAYSMTDWRIGYAAAPKEIVAAMNKIHQHNTTCAPSFAQRAAIAALREERDEVALMVREYQRRRDYAVAEINGMEGVSCLPPKGSFYIFINVKKLGISCAEAADYLLAEAKIALVPGGVFGKNGEGYLRMSFANSLKNIAEGCERMKKALKELAANKK